MKRELRDKLDELAQLDVSETSPEQFMEDVEKIVNEIECIIDKTYTKINGCLSEITARQLDGVLSSIRGLEEASEMLY